MLLQLCTDRNCVLCIIVYIVPFRGKGIYIHIHMCVYVYVYIHTHIHIYTHTYIHTFTFSRRFYPKRLTIAFRLYIFISMCVPWESNPQPFALLTQCSTTEPHRNTYIYIHTCIYIYTHTYIYILVVGID